jgi:2-iminobutanoate/2-iminopropanoate deaminase
MIEFLMVPGAPVPVAPFSHVVTADGWIFVTGQMPTDPADDGAPLPDGIEAQTRRVIENLKLVLVGVGSGLDRVVFARVYLTESNGMAAAFVKTFKRDYVRVSPIPNAAAALALIASWMDYNIVHPHSRLGYRSPRMVSGSASINCAVMRTRLPARRTLPSSR